jgi:catechol 2,3-dioxygenase-like lactoylglutathione lyase family enzyme
VVPSLEGLAPFQVAFVVGDLERAVRAFDTRLGAGPWRGWIFGPQGRGREYRGRPAEWTLKLALNNRSPQYELIEPRQGPSIHADWLAERGEGMHHVGVIVDSLEQAVSAMSRAGYPVIQSGAGFGAERDGAYAYFDTTAHLGLVVEAVEPPGRMPEPDFVWPR